MKARSSTNMKLLLALVLGISALAADEPKAPPADELARSERLLEQPWRSMSVKMESWLGDYWNHGPEILLQKAQDETIIVSWIGGPELNQLPVVSKVLPKKEGEALKALLAKVFRKGIGETSDVEKMSEKEIDEFIDRTNHSPGYIELVLRVAGPDAKTQEMKTKCGSDWKEGALIQFLQLAETLEVK